MLPSTKAWNSEESKSSDETIIVVFFFFFMTSLDQRLNLSDLCVPSF